MNQEIEGKLRDILYKFAEEYSAADYLHSEENGIKPNLNWRVKNATNKIKELVCSTVPERFCSKVNDNDGGGSYEQRIGFNTACIEILKKWT